MQKSDISEEVPGFWASFSAGSNIVFLVYITAELVALI